MVRHDVEVHTHGLPSIVFCVLFELHIIQIGHEIGILNRHAIRLCGFGQCRRDLLWPPTALVKYLMQQTGEFCRCVLMLLHFLSFCPSYVMFN